MDNKATYMFHVFLLLDIGNDNIHLISTYSRHELSIYMERPNKEHRWGNYSTFSLADEVSKYVLTVTGYTGNAGCKCISPFSLDELHFQNKLHLLTLEFEIRIILNSIKQNKKKKVII